MITSWLLVLVVVVVHVVVSRKILPWYLFFPKTRVFFSPGVRWAWVDLLWFGSGVSSGRVLTVCAGVGVLLATTYCITY